MSGHNPVVRVQDVQIAERCVVTINAYWAERGLNAGATLGKRAAVQSNLNAIGFHLNQTAKVSAPSARRQRARQAQGAPNDRECGQIENTAVRRSRAKSPGGLNLR
jgi:hypothetical protein